MENIIYIITITIYSIFIIRFLLSWIGGDFEIDADVDLGDVVSFKGATHFLMGFFGWISTKSYLVHSLDWYDLLVGFIIGLIFVYILFYVYKLMLKLESKPEILSGKNLIGYPATIYLSEGNGKFIITVNNGFGTSEIKAKSNNSYITGDKVQIIDYDGTYYIIK